MVETKLSDNDKLFLSALNTASLKAQTIVTNKALVSEELLAALGVETGASNGAWMFNVYVEFEPMFKSKHPETWQEKRIL